MKDNKHVNKFDEAFNKRVADMLRTHTGQEFMNWMEETYFNQISYSRNDPHHTSFMEGGRDVVFDIKKRIEKYGHNSG